MPWYQTWGGNFVDKTSQEEWTKCMNDERVITLEDLSEGWGTYTSILAPRSSLSPSQAIYDLQGRHLSKAPSKGVYILNGKKVMAHQ